MDLRMFLDFMFERSREKVTGGSLYPGSDDVGVSPPIRRSRSRKPRCLLNRQVSGF